MPINFEKEREGGKWRERERGRERGRQMFFQKLFLRR
jgi:hypothetical protein